MLWRVTWEIDLDDDDPVEAAEHALRIQRNPDSIATVFNVLRRDHPDALNPGPALEVDLTEGTVRRLQPWEYTSPSPAP